MFKQMEIAEQVYEEITPSENSLGYIPTVTVMSVNRREENPPRLTTPIRAALEIARQNMQAIQAMV